MKTCLQGWPFPPGRINAAARLSTPIQGCGETGSRSTRFPLDCVRAERVVNIGNRLHLELPASPLLPHRPCDEADQDRHHTT